MIEQMGFYDYFQTPTWNKPLRLCELFGGLGSQHKALKNIGVEVSEHYLVEVDINATISYAAIHCELNNHLEDDVPCDSYMIEYLKPMNWWHNEKPYDISKLKSDKLKKLYLAQKLSNNFGDVFQLEDLPEVDLITWSTPCQDFSNAGKKAGFTGFKGNLTQVTLDLFGKLTHKPLFLLFENVPMIVSDMFVDGFNYMLRQLDELGYENIVMKLNAKDYGVPQNRERVFILSVRKDYESYYSPPKPFPLELRLKDMLEDNVDESYYLTDKQLEQISKWNSQQQPLETMKKIQSSGICTTITARGAGEEHSGMILIPEATKQGYKEAYDGDGIYLDRPHQKRGVVQSGMIPTLKTSGDDIGVVVSADGFTSNESVEFSKKPLKNMARTIKANKIDSCVIVNDLRIRKLTPLECWRLMGFDDEDYHNAAPHMSKSALYKSSGNSIVVDVLENIFENLFMKEDKQ